MDPLAHSLIGATLGETALKKRTPLARFTLIVAANLPDIDGLCSPLGRDVSLGFRRGHTHGVVAMLVLPALLTGVIVWYDRRFRRPKGLAPVVPGAVLGLALLGVLSHPALDWLNNYGVRLLMPFDPTWFYGDAIFIIDPWIWLTSASVVMLANSASWRSRSAWGVLALLTTTLVLATSYPPLGAKIAWSIGVVVLIAIRVYGVSENALPKLALVTTALIFAYVASMVLGTKRAETEARAWFAARGVQAERIMAGPLPANPLERDIIVQAKGQYHFAHLSWAREPNIRIAEAPVPISDSARARDALSKRPGLQTWIRFPAFIEARAKDGSPTVEVRDVRYDRFGANLGRATIRVEE